MPVTDPLLVPATGSALASSDDYNANLNDIEDGLYELGGGTIVSGGGIVSDVALVTTIEASEYFISIPLPKPQTAVSLTDNATNRVWAVPDPDHADRVVYEVRTNTSTPERGVPVRVIVTSGGAITSNVVHPDLKEFKPVGDHQESVNRGNAQLTSSQNNYILGKNKVVYLSSDASRDITGIVATFDGDRRTIINNGAQDIVFKHNSGSSSAGNKIRGIAGADVTLAAEQAAELLYDATLTMWRVLWKM